MGIILSCSFENPSLPPGSIPWENISELELEVACPDQLLPALLLQAGTGLGTRRSHPGI